MAQQISRGNIFGRIGAGIGKGLAESVPQEIAHQRKRIGLENLANDLQQENLSPLQIYSKAAGIYGATPQDVQSATELAKQYGTRQAFKRAAKFGEDGINQQEQAPQQNKPIIDQRNIQSKPPQNGISSQNLAARGAEAGTEQTLPQRNPLSNELLPVGKFTPDQWINEMANAQEVFPNYTNQELKDYVREKEERRIAAPQAQQAIDSYKEGIQDKAYSAFDDLLETKLQKKEAATFADVPGVLQNKLKRGMVNELIANPRANVKDVAEKWTELGLRRAKILNDINVDANKGFFSKSPSQVLSDLYSFSSNFRDVGDSENYKDILQETFKFSPQRASQIAFQPSKSIDKYLKSIKPDSPHLKALAGLHKSVPDFTQVSMKRASDLQNYITPSDSVQAIARHIKDIDPYFDEEIFFQYLKDQIADDERENPYTGRQKQEISKGRSDKLPNWADVWYFPFSGKRS